VPNTLTTQAPGGGRAGIPGANRPVRSLWPKFEASFSRSLQRVRNADEFGSTSFAASRPSTPVILLSSRNDNDNDNDNDNENEMGKKKSKSTSLSWCWYCDREFEDDRVLLQHQKGMLFDC
jgi:hypothetical protein